MNAAGIAARDSELTAQAVGRIAGHWADASAEDLATGLDWYARAEAMAESLAAGTPFTTRQCAGVIAALSPRCTWSANVRGAASMVAAAAAGEPEPITAGTRSNRSKAWRILADDVVDPLDVLGGPKVRRFYRNITGDHACVTVDVWAAAAAEGGKSDVAPKGRRYARIETAYQQAAELLGVEPRELQAAVWTYFRRVTARALYDNWTPGEVA